MDKYILKSKDKDIYYYGHCEWGPDLNNTVTFTRSEIMALCVDQPIMMSQCEIIKLHKLLYE